MDDFTIAVVVLVLLAIVLMIFGGLIVAWASLRKLWEEHD